MQTTDLDYARVTGRFGISVGDSADPGEEPDLAWIASGNLTITPKQETVKVVASTPSPVTVMMSPVRCTFSNGYLSYQGQNHVYVVDLTSEKVNPRIGASLATHRVTITDAVASDGTLVNFQAFDVRITKLGVSGDGVNDLTLLAPVISGAPTPIYVGPAGPPGPAGADGPPGNGSVDTVNGIPGPNPVLDYDDVGAAAAVHTHDDRYFTEAETNSAISTASTADRLRANHSGTQSADTLTDGSTNRLYTTTEKNKLAGIATAATANSTDALLLNRSNHTGTQTSTTISDFQEAAQDAIASMLAGTNGVTLNYNDAENTLTITGGGAGGGVDDEAVRDLMGVALVASGLINIVVNDAADTITISTTATQNSTDSALRDRTTHTGSQAQSTVTNLVSDLAGKAATTHTHTKSQITDFAHTHAVADLPAGTTLSVIYNGSAWPARPTARTDVVVMWIDYLGTSVAPSGGISGVDMYVKDSGI